MAITIEELKQYREEVEQEIAQIESIDYDEDIAQKLAEYKAKLEQEVQEKKNALTADKKMELKALDRIIEKYSVEETTPEAVQTIIEE